MPTKKSGSRKSSIPKGTAKSKPTTGNKRIDEIVQENFSAAIDVGRQVIMDLIPDVDPELAGKAAAVFVSQIWRYMANVIVMGAPVYWNEEQDA